MTITITNSRFIGRAHGHDMQSWDEVDEDGVVRSFEEYPTTCYLPKQDITIGLTMVREVTLDKQA